MSRLLYWSLLSVVGGLLLHLAILFVLPYVSTQSVWKRALALSKPEAVSIHPLRHHDPFFVTKVCPLEIFDNPVQIRQKEQGQYSAYWSMAIYSQTGEVITSLNAGDNDGVLDVVVAQPEDQFLLQDTLSDTIIVTTRRAIAIVRQFRPRYAAGQNANAADDQVDCTPWESN